MEGRGPGGSVGDTPDAPPPPQPDGAGPERPRRFGLQSQRDTPLVIDGIMYLATPYSRAVAIDPTTGKELWATSCPPATPQRAASNTGPATAKPRRRSSSDRATARCTR